MYKGKLLFCQDFQQTIKLRSWIVGVRHAVARRYPARPSEEIENLPQQRFVLQRTNLSLSQIHLVRSWSGVDCLKRSFRIAEKQSCVSRNFQSCFVRVRSSEVHRYRVWCFVTEASTERSELKIVCVFYTFYLLALYHLNFLPRKITIRRSVVKYFLLICLCTRQL